MTEAVYVIYRIICFATGKSYVGKTNNWKRRKAEHFNNLRLGKHYNLKLQRAYDKYGSESFYFELLEINIQTEMCSEKERWWIAHLNSLEDGFNITEGGEGGGQNSVKCVWNGIEYASLTAAAIANNITDRAMRTRIQNGQTCDFDVSIKQSPCVWNGVRYSSIAEAAIANKVKKSTMVARIARGYTCDEDIGFYYQQGKPCIWNGVSYRSMAEAARANNVNRATMQERISRGYTCDEDMIGKGRPGIRRK